MYLDWKSNYPGGRGTSNRLSSFCIFLSFSVWSLTWQLWWGSLDEFELESKGGLNSAFHFFSSVEPDSHIFGGHSSSFTVWELKSVFPWWFCITEDKEGDFDTFSWTELKCELKIDILYKKIPGKRMFCGMIFYWKIQERSLALLSSTFWHLFHRRYWNHFASYVQLFLWPHLQQCEVVPIHPLSLQSYWWKHRRNPN